MKTAVEWLAEKYDYAYWMVKRDEISPALAEEWKKHYLEQAKEMEKEQMKDSYKKGFSYRDTWNWELNVDWNEDCTKENENEFEQYYNETFKSK